MSHLRKPRIHTADCTCFACSDQPEIRFRRHGRASAWDAALVTLALLWLPAMVALALFFPR